MTMGFAKDGAHLNSGRTASNLTPYEPATAPTPGGDRSDIAGREDILRLVETFYTRAFADEVIRVPVTAPLLAPLLTVVPLQVFALWLSTAKGLDVDQPRNLAKSVTVE